MLQVFPDPGAACLQGICPHQAVDLQAVVGIVFQQAADQLGAQKSGGPGKENLPALFRRFPVFTGQLDTLVQAAFVGEVDCFGGAPVSGQDRMDVFRDADNGSVTQQFPQIQFDMEFLFNIIDQFKAHQGIPAESQERVVQVKMFDLQYPLESRAHLQEDLICPVNNVLCPLLRMPLGIALRLAEEVFCRDEPSGRRGCCKAPLTSLPHTGRGPLTSAACGYPSAESYSGGRIPHHKRRRQSGRKQLC